MIGISSTSRSQRGAAAVEFALVLPILILLIFGIVQFSILFNRQQGLHAAAREGARYAALPNHSQEDVVGRVEAALSGVISPSDVTITVLPDKDHPCDLQPNGTAAIVEIRMDAELDIPLFGVRAGTLTGRGEFRCE